MFYYLHSILHLFKYPATKMIQYKLHRIIIRLVSIGCFVSLFFIAMHSCAPGKKNAGQYYDSLPPPPPPPPPPMEQNDNSSLSEATLKKIESTKVLIAAQLTTMAFNGNRENDYLVRVMQLNHNAISNLSSSQLGNTAANEALNTQADYFLKAVDLVQAHASKQAPVDTSVLSRSLQQKELNIIKDELVRVSKEYSQSGTDPAVLSFATKIIKDSGKENE